MVFGNTHAPCLQLRVLGSLHFLRPTARRFYWYHDAHSRSGTMAVFKGASAGAASNKRLKLRASDLGRNCVCAPKSSVVVSITAAPAKCGAAASARSVRRNLGSHFSLTASVIRGRSWEPEWNTTFLVRYPKYLSVTSTQLRRTTRTNSALA